jgi:COMPASS component SWD3
VSGSDDKTLRLWDVETATCVRVLEGHTEVLDFSFSLSSSDNPPNQTVASVCALSDGNRVVSGSYDKTVRVWDVDRGSCALIFEGHSGVREY